MRPGGKLATRPLDFIFLIDASTSMKQLGKMDSLNDAIKQAIPHMRRAADDNPNATVRLRAITFSSGAKWHIEEAVDIETFEWEDVSAGGLTDMGLAFELLADALDVKNMSERALPPVLVLISDGQPTDKYQAALDRVLQMPWGTKAVKLAIAIGKGANERVLKSFINNDAIDVLKADNAHHLVEYIKWASTVVLSAASSPVVQGDDDKESNVYLPALVHDFWENIEISASDVW